MMPNVVGNLMGKKRGGEGGGSMELLGPWGGWSHRVIRAIRPLEPRGKSIESYHKL